MPKKTKPQKATKIFESKLHSIQNLVDSIRVESNYFEIISTIESIHTCCGSNNLMQNWADALIAKKYLDLVSEEMNYIAHIEIIEDKFLHEDDLLSGDCAAKYDIVA